MLSRLKKYKSYTEVYNGYFLQSFNVDAVFDCSRFVCQLACYFDKDNRCLQKITGAFIE